MIKAKYVGVSPHEDCFIVGVVDAHNVLIADRADNYGLKLRTTSIEYIRIPRTRLSMFDQPDKAPTEELKL